MRVATKRGAVRLAESGENVRPEILSCWNRPTSRRLLPVSQHLADAMPALVSAVEALP